MKAVKRVYDARELLWNFTLRELRTKYRRSFLGWTWSMLNPLAAVAIYGFVFGIVFRAAPPVGDPSGIDNFALFLVAGLIPWSFFSLVNNLGLGSIASNSALVKRVAFPREILVFSNVLHACVQFAIELTLLCIIFALAGSPFFPWIPMIVLTAMLLAVFGTGIALVLAALAVYFRDLNYLWLIVLQAWFFATPIVYPPALLEEQAPASECPQAEPDERVCRDLPPPALRCRTMVGLFTISAVSLIVGWTIFNRMRVDSPKKSDRANTSIDFSVVSASRRPIVSEVEVEEIVAAQAEDRRTASRRRLSGRTRAATRV
jgi:lipopolysaccharide transport system permease protein